MGIVCSPLVLPNKIVTYSDGLDPGKLDLNKRLEGSVVVALKRAVLTRTPVVLLYVVADRLHRDGYCSNAE